MLPFRSCPISPHPCQCRSRRARNQSAGHDPDVACTDYRMHGTNEIMRRIGKSKILH